MHDSICMQNHDIKKKFKKKKKNRAQNSTHAAPRTSNKFFLGHLYGL